jgi:hypothetical protein
MQFDYPHDLDLDEATQRLERLGAYLTNRHGIRVEWRDRECTIDGNYLMVKIEGKMSVSETNIHFDGRDPGMLWRKKAVKYLKEKLEMYLDLSTPISELPIDKV